MTANDTSERQPPTARCVSVRECSLVPRRPSTRRPSHLYMLLMCAPPNKKRNVAEFSDGDQEARRLQRSCDAAVRWAHGEFEIIHNAAPPLDWCAWRDAREASRRPTRLRRATSQS